MGSRLAGKITLVTGAGSGLGEATAKRFAAEGAHVFVTDVDAAAAQRVAGEIGKAATARVQDVTDEADWDVLMGEIIDAHDKLDVIVNNAGIGMKDTGGGSIINISSIEGMIGEPMAAAYNASKGGVRIFTKSAALHCAAQGYNIRVNSVHPGFIMTPLLETGIGSLPEAEAAAMLERVTREIPLGAMGEPVDIANGCLFLASDESKYMTGSELVIDGGFTSH